MIFRAVWEEISWQSKRLERRTENDQEQEAALQKRTKKIASINYATGANFRRLDESGRWARNRQKSDISTVSIKHNYGLNTEEIVFRYDAHSLASVRQFFSSVFFV